MDFPAHDTYRKEQRKLRKQLGEQPLYDSSPTLPRVQVRTTDSGLIHSMEFAARGDVDPIEREAKWAVAHICNNPLTIFEGSLNITIPESKGSSVIFLRRTLGGKVW